MKKRDSFVTSEVISGERFRMEEKQLSRRGCTLCKKNLIDPKLAAEGRKICKPCNKAEVAQIRAEG